MEPLTAISALAKFIGLGIKGWKTFGDHVFDEKDLAAIQSLLETGTSLASTRTQGTPVAAQHLALVAQSFGRAVGRHQEFHGKLLLSGGLPRWLSLSDRQRAEEIELRVKVAALKLQQLGNDPQREVDLVRVLTSPLASPYYQRLWRAFSDPALTLSDEEPPLVMSQTARREFERYFLLAYMAAMATPAGRTVATYLDDLSGYRAILVRELLLEDMATWGGRHVFGNVARERWSDDDPVPFLALEDLYVEPLGAIEQRPGRRGDAVPLAELVEQLATAKEARVVLVVADFGSGKSLTARKLAWRWAERWLDTTDVSLDVILPIYVRCADDFPHEVVDLPGTVRTAWQRQGNSFGLQVAVHDEALAWPEDGQRVVCLLDGLDEVVLGERQLKTLLQTLIGRTSERHRFVVFSRPGAVPARHELGERFVVVRVLPFGAAQVEGWIDRWNRLRAHQPPVNMTALQRLGLDELVHTPILLFMVALTWSQYTERTDRVARAAIYESFFQQIATGKAKADKEQHNPIAAASATVLVALTERGVLEPEAERSDAMLWLMGRVAWEAQMLEQYDRPRPLTTSEVAVLLRTELELDRDACQAIEVGLLLALQSDLRTADHQILFGHQSFREFLVARHWALQLHRLVRSSQREWDFRTHELIGGRLLGAENSALDSSCR